MRLINKLSEKREARLISQGRELKIFKEEENLVENGGKSCE
jgi:hypothetical protein